MCLYKDCNTLIDNFYLSLYTYIKYIFRIVFKSFGIYKFLSLESTRIKLARIPAGSKKIEFLSL